MEQTIAALNCRGRHIELSTCRNVILSCLPVGTSYWQTFILYGTLRMIGTVSASATAVYVTFTAKCANYQNQFYLIATLSGNTSTYRLFCQTGFTQRCVWLYDKLTECIIPNLIKIRSYIMLRYSAL